MGFSNYYKPSQRLPKAETSKCQAPRTLPKRKRIAAFGSGDIEFTN
jgi:hypothetical protein